MWCDQMTLELDRQCAAVRRAQEGWKLESWIVGSDYRVIGPNGETKRFESAESAEGFLRGVVLVRYVEERYNMGRCGDGPDDAMTGFMLNVMAMIGNRMDLSFQKQLDLVDILITEGG